MRGCTRERDSKNPRFPCRLQRSSAVWVAISGIVCQVPRNEPRICMPVSSERLMGLVAARWAPFASPLKLLGSCPTRMRITTPITRSQVTRPITLATKLARPKKPNTATWATTSRKAMSTSLRRRWSFHQQMIPVETTQIRLCVVFHLDDLRWSVWIPSTIGPDFQPLPRKLMEIKLSELLRTAPTTTRRATCLTGRDRACWRSPAWSPRPPACTRSRSSSLPGRSDSWISERESTSQFGNRLMMDG